MEEQKNTTDVEEFLYKLYPTENLESIRKNHSKEIQNLQVFQINTLMQARNLFRSHAIWSREEAMDNLRCASLEINEALTCGFPNYHYDYKNPYPYHWPPS